MNEKRLISLASGTLPEFDPIVVVEAAAAAEFTGCGVWFDAETWEPKTTKALANAFKASGLTPLEIEVIMVGEDFDLDSSNRVFEAGGEIGCTESIIACTDADHSRFADMFGRIVEQASTHEINACLEFLPIFSVGTLGQALAVLEVNKAPNAKLLLDPIHVQRSGATIEQLSEIDPDLISFAQFCDGLIDLPGLGDLDDKARWVALRDDAVDGRSCAGEGELPLQQFVATLPHGLPLSMELRSKALRDAWPDPKDRARAVFTTTQKWLETHDQL